MENLRTLELMKEAYENRDRETFHSYNIPKPIFDAYIESQEKDLEYMIFGNNNMSYTEETIIELTDHVVDLGVSDIYLQEGFAIRAEAIFYFQNAGWKMVQAVKADAFMLHMHYEA